MAEAVTFKGLVSRADFKLAICLNISFDRELQMYCAKHVRR